MCFNKLTDKLLVSRNVIHHKTCFPFVILTSASSPIDTDMVYGTSSSTRPIVVQLGTNITMPHNSSQSATQFHNKSLNSPLSSNMLPSASISDSSSQDHIQHYHSSITTHPSSHATLSFSPPMLPVISLNQLEVVLPSRPGSPEVSHGIQTRLKTGAITKIDYSALMATFLEITSLNLHDDNHISAGFTFIADSTDSL